MIRYDMIIYVMIAEPFSYVPQPFFKSTRNSKQLLG